MRLFSCPTSLSNFHIMGRTSRRRRSPASRRRLAHPLCPAAALRHELTTKRRGELAELAFTLKAASLGFGVSKPYGDSERYDFILDSRDLIAPPTISSPLWRVQVKCSTQLIDGLYRVNAHRRIHGRAVPYQLSEIDFLVAYIIPEDSWFILPLPAILGRTSLLFRRKRDRKPGLYDPYREAWPLLRPKNPHEL